MWIRTAHFPLPPPVAPPVAPPQFLHAAFDDDGPFPVQAPGRFLHGAFDDDGPFPAPLPLPPPDRYVEHMRHELARDTLRKHNYFLGGR
ncbi:unnamed protein product [Arabis nemorensis]|uniref:Uncharacterized protein n=1 Tax=Arabis nemorensis TaxID=586526 RepID=A0A565BVZ0_9BRAS|nr:unnamed protein product [Arabis nemorensis]